MCISISFMTLSGPFKTLRTAEFATQPDALAAVHSHAASAGYRDVRRVTDEDGSTRYTAKPPGGRSGRNIAFEDW